MKSYSNKSAAQLSLFRFSHRRQLSGPGGDGGGVGGGGGGGTPIYKPYRYVPPQRVSFSSISSLK